MGRKNISISLSRKSINNAIQYIRDYKKALDGRLVWLVNELANNGMKVTNAIMSQVPDDVLQGAYDCYLEVVDSSEGTYSAKIVLQNDQILFIEFSAGIWYGTDSFQPLPGNPQYGDGYGMGTYPSEKHLWDNPGGWYYTDADGTSGHHSYGTMAYQPMYHTAVEMREIIVGLAKQAFGDY